MNWRSKLQNIARKWFRSASVTKAGQKQRRRPQPQLELLENRVTPAGALSLTSNVLTLADTGSPTITVGITSNNYTITDTNGLTGTISGWTISGNTATETNAGAASITGLTFNTTGATIGSAGITAGPATAITITDAGSVTIGGAISGGTTGNLSISAAGSIADNANITLTTGTITIAADTAHSGTAGFTESASAVITTTSVAATAMSITVNTSAGGTGNATLGTINVGTTAVATGELAVRTFGGSILYAGSSFPNTVTGTAPSVLITAAVYSFTSTGSSSVGTSAAPLQLGGGLTSDDQFPSISTGSGGIYVTDWWVSSNSANAQNVVFGSGGVPAAMATGGNIQLISAGSSGSGKTINLDTEGPITTVGSGTILLEDNGESQIIDDSTIGSIGAATGSGATVTFTVSSGAIKTVTATPAAGGTGYPASSTFDLLVTGGGGSAGVVQATTNSSGVVTAFALVSGGSGYTATTGAATINNGAFSGTVTFHGDMTSTTAEEFNFTAGSAIITTNTSAGAVDLDNDYTGATTEPIIVGNITTGNGGTITIGGASGSTNDITQVASTTLNAGSTGSVVLTGSLSTAGNEIGTSTQSINVTAANVTTSATNGNTFVSDSVAGSFTSTVAITGNITLATTAGALTIGGAISTAASGTVTLTGAGGVVLNAALGSSTTGAIAIAGALSGSSNITLGTGGLTETQTTSSTYVGAISGSEPVAISGTGTLTLSNTSTYSGSTTVTNGTLVVSGSLADTSGVTVSNGGTLTVSGTSTYSGSTAITGGTLVVSGSGNLADTSGVTVSNGGTFTVTGTSTYSGPTTVTSGTLFVNGSLPNTNVTVSGTGALEGSGSIGGTVSDNSIIAPGGGVGGTAELSTGSLTLGSSDTYEIDLNNTTAGSGYDQLNVTGNVSLSGALTIDAATGLTQGETFTIINATGTVSGNLSFAGVSLGNGATFKANPVDIFMINYTGNTVVLTLSSVQPTPQVDITNGVLTYYSPRSGASSATLSESGTTYTVADAATNAGNPITLSQNAISAGWTMNGDGSVSGPASSFSSMDLDMLATTNAIAGVNAIGDNVTIIGYGGVGAPLTVTGAITNAGQVAISAFSSVDFENAVTASGTITVTGVSSITGNSTGGTTGTLTGTTVTFVGSGSGTETINETIPVVGNLTISGYSTVDFEGNSHATNTVSWTGSLTISGAANITDGTNGTADTLSASALNLTASTGIGTSAKPVLTAVSTITVSAGSAGIFLKQASGGAVSFTGTATGAGNVSLVDTDTTDPTVTIAGATSTGSGAITISATGAIADNANINAGSGTIAISADTAGTGTPTSASFTEAPSGVTITTTNTGTSALVITVNTSTGGTGNAYIRTIADSGTLSIKTFGGSILYSGTDTFLSAVTKITEASGSNVATVTPAGTTQATGATGFYAGEQVTITGTNGVFDGTYTIQSVNSSGTTQVAEPSFTITTSTAASNALSVSAGNISAPNGTLEAQALGVVGSDNLGSAPTGDVTAATYSFTATGAGSIGTATRPIQTNTPATTNSFTLTAGSGGVYLVDWDKPITLAGATATGAGNIVVVTANAGGHNLTVSGNVSTGSGNILLAADDELIINSGVTIGGSGFSGQVYLAATETRGTTRSLRTQVQSSPVTPAFTTIPATP